jgi:hypothetical protein
VTRVLHLRHAPSPRTSRAALLGDLQAYDPTAGAWTNLCAAVSGTAPPARSHHGLAATGGKLYVHGGAVAPDGNDRGGGALGSGMCISHIFESREHVIDLC